MAGCRPVADRSLAGRWPVVPPARPLYDGPRRRETPISAAPNARTLAARRRGPAMDLKLSDKVVFVSGASGGIGTALAEAFAEEGARLVLHAHRSYEALRAHA